MANNYTPGPWSLNDGSNPYTSDEYHEIGIGNTAGRLTGWVKKKDALLVAAAPELFEALDILMTSYNKNGHLLNFNVDIARQAIAKAKGESED